MECAMPPLPYVKILICLCDELQWRLNGMRYASPTVRQDVMKEVQADVFPRFGLPVGGAGNLCFMERLARCMDDAKIMQLVATINLSSGMDASTCKAFQDALDLLKSAQ